MPPSKRVLLRAKIEDSVEGNNTVTTLMGDLAEPRREFIEPNAMNVPSLDV